MKEIVVVANFSLDFFWSAAHFPPQTYSAVSRIPTLAPDELSFDVFEVEIVWSRALHSQGRHAVVQGDELGEEKESLGAGSRSASTA